MEIETALEWLNFAEADLDSARIEPVRFLCK
jgi:hypothetical protein